jgi:pimeloyl-ACP methyl ester carboxylesterase
MDHLTVMGHGFGATTSISMASKDPRVKKVISLDPWLIPLKEEILKNKTLTVI